VTKKKKKLKLTRRKKTIPQKDLQEQLDENELKINTYILFKWKEHHSIEHSNGNYRKEKHSNGNNCKGIN
jgi:hypothetical protein